ncbi:MAG: hypothetical protein LBS00_09080 [Synergistaceae bacterium]|nr:hypothetical protein [Synergistaceae bacterium]
MSQGLGMVGANAAYSVAQRSALSAVEFLPREIAYASQVEIISDPAHVITDTLLSEDWHYIARAAQGVHHLYWDGEHGERREELVPGSEFVTDLQFDADVFSPDQYGGGRVALFRVEAQNDKKSVVLERSRLVHALEGVMGEDNVSLDAAFPGGPILRYKMRIADTSVEANLFGSLNTDDETPLFDYSKPDTWDRVKHYTTMTKIDATLKLSEDALNELDPAELPVFTWIVAQTDSFFSKYQELSGDLFDSREKTEKQEKLLSVLKEDDYLKDRLEDRAVGKRATANPLNLKKTPFEQGYQILEVSRGAQVDTDTYGTESYLDLGGIVNTSLSQPGAYQGAHLIVIAHYKDKDGAWNMAPAFAALGEEQSSGSLWDRVMDVVNQTGAFEGGFLNQHKDLGKVVSELNKDTGRWAFTVYGGYGAKRRAPQMLLTLTGEDFKHLEPKDPLQPNLYGVTNYALYLEGQLTYTGRTKTPDGGYGVLLNGSEPQSVQVDSVKEHLSSGYTLQLDPGAGGYFMGYGFYKTPDLRQVEIVNREGNRLNVYDYDMNVSFGVHPLYAYDAAKSYHGKPRTMEAPQIVNFFASRDPGDRTILSEDLNRHVGILNPDQRVFYRLPFMPQRGKDGGDKDPYYTRESVLRTFSRGRDKIGLNFAPAYGGAYGMTYGGSDWSVYNLRHMQTWQLYYKELDAKGGSRDPETKIVTDFPSRQDTRRGYRWDLRDTRAEALKEVPIALRTRHLVKMTVLEVTRDILASEVEEGWRARRHHDGSSDAGYDPRDVIHQAGDLFVRLETIQVKEIDGDVAGDINDSRAYYYSKPIWFGKFKGDYWKGDSPTLFKKMGNRTMHIVSPPEPKGGDRKTFQRRGMRIRSWKDNFTGWDFDNPNYAGGTYAWKDDLIGENPKHPDLTVGDDTIWTPPIAIDLKGHGIQGDWSKHNQHPKIRDQWQNPQHSDFGHNSVGAGGKIGADNKGFTNDVHFNYQWGDRFADTYGNYGFPGQKVKLERRRKDNKSPYVYAYGGYYDNEIYARMSMQRPYGDSTPLYGLYALRGWEYLRYDLPGTGEKGPINPVYDRNGYSYADVNGKIYESSSKRLLMVVQGLQMPYQPSLIELKGEIVQPDLDSGSINHYRRAPEGTSSAVYRKDRVRTLGLRFWSGPNGQTTNNANNPNQFKLYDMWFEEGFTPKEVRAVLGLDPSQFPDSTLDQEIPKLYGTE